MYANIVVLTYQPPETDSYTYEVPKELEWKIKIGQLVSVPFGKRNPYGVISSIVNRQSSIVKNIKPLTSIILEKPILLPYQIELLEWMSSYYLAPMVNCLEAMLPEIPRKLSIVNSKWGASIHHSPLTINQTIVLVPSINHLPQILAQFSQAKNYTVYTNELKASERFTIWQKILSGNCDFIFGSRSAIFTPCPNLKKIIIFDEHESAFKDDRSPYFDTLTVAEKITTLTGAKIQIIDSAPRITTFANHENDITFPVIASTSMSLRAERSNLSVNSAKQSREQIASGSSSTRNDKMDLPQTKIISLANDRKLGNYSPISIPLEEIIKRAYVKKLSILLFLNKRIESGSIYCKNCKHQEFFKSQPEMCPNCKSPEIFFNSTNINSLTREVKKILPNIQINLIAENLNQLPATSYQQPIVTIATSSVFYKLMTRKYDLVAHIYADSPLNFNEYNSTEEIYSQITNLKKLTKKLLVIQTYNEDLPALKFAVSNDYPAFYKSELAPRKILNYPPYALLVKISVTGKKEIEIESKSQKLFEELSNSLRATSYQQPVTCLGPFKAPVKTNPTYNIIIKIKIPDYSLKSRANVIAKITQTMPKQKDFKIVIEPKSLN